MCVSNTGAGYSKPGEEIINNCFRSLGLGHDAFVPVIMAIQPPGSAHSHVSLMRTTLTVPIAILLYPKSIISQRLAFGL